MEKNLKKGKRLRAHKFIWLSWSMSMKRDGAKTLLFIKYKISLQTLGCNIPDL